MNKCIKIIIKKCKNITNRDLNKILWELQKKTAQASNMAMRMYYNWEYEKIKYKEEHGIYPKEKEMFNKTYINVVNGEMKKIMNTSYARNVDQTNQMVKSKWSTDKKDILCNRKSVANFKSNMPIYICGNGYKISQGNMGYEIDCAIFNTKQEFTHLIFNIDKLDSNKKATLNKIISGTYKQGTIQIQQNRKNKWEMIISFSFEPIKKELDYNRILGVDLGITNVATMQILDTNINKYERLSYKECMIDGKELIHFRQKTEARKKQLSIASKYCGQGRIGHGYKTRMKPVNRAGDAVNRFKDTYNHAKSKYIIDFAIKHNCGIIQMEDLSGFTEQQSESFLKNWSYYDLQNKIQYKADEVGIKVIFINPKYTSKRCNKCGNIHIENRDCKNNQAKFKCVICGHEDNADMNAAKNIAIPNIDEIINTYITDKNKLNIKLSKAV
jgi:IS605 OrfB family transposase